MVYKLILATLLSLNLMAKMDQTTATITNVSSDQATIDIGNLKYGQSGIVVHNYDNDNSIVLSNAIVINSDANESKVRLMKFDDLTQDALPTTNIKPSNGDKMILNYLYNRSLLVAPNGSSYANTKMNFSSQTFVNSDIFASFLKLNYKPIPSKVDFQQFCKANSLGTIYFVIDNKVYIVDAKSFVILDEHNIVNDDTKQEVPFYTMVDEIKNGAFSWFEGESIGDYNNYYSSLIEVGTKPKSNSQIVIIEEDDSIFTKYLEKIGF